MRRQRRLGVLILAFSLLAAACSSGKGTLTGEPGGDAGTEPSGVTSSGTGGSSIASSGVDVFSGLGAVSTPPGLTTTARASSTAPATTAVIVVEPEPRGSFITPGGGQLQPQDRKAVVDAVTALGVPPDAVSFDGRGVYGFPRVQVTVPVGAVSTTGQQVVDAVEKVLGRAGNQGVAYFTSDCGAATAALQKQAFQGAEAKARQLADNTGVRLGGPVSVTEVQSNSSLSSLAGRSAVDPCDPASLDTSDAASLKPLESKPVVDVTVGLAVTWGIAGSAPTGSSGPRSELAAAGRGSVTNAADEAYVVVIYSPDDPQSAQPVTQKDRDDVEKAVVALGIAKKDMEIVSDNQFGSPVTIVQVETKVSDVAKRGDQIQHAVEKVLGRSDTAGVRFGLSTCDQAVAKARKAAVADARGRAAALADAVGVHIGDVQTVSEVSSLTAVDPCADDAASLLQAGDYGDYSATVKAFDAKPEVRIESIVRLGFPVTG